MIKQIRIFNRTEDFIPESTYDGPYYSSKDEWDNVVEVNSKGEEKPSDDDE